MSSEDKRVVLIRVIKGLPLHPPRDGFCRLCNEPVNEPRRIRWHSRCNKEYTQSLRPIRSICEDRDHGVCAQCGEVDSKWQADHITPLHLGGSHNPNNLQTLCSRHHKQKSAEEAGERKKARE